jgi:hypothetical protein
VFLKFLKQNSFSFKWHTTDVLFGYNIKDSFGLFQGWIYCFGGCRTIKMWKPLSVPINLGHDFFIIISYSNWNYKPAFHDFRDATVSIKSVDSISVLWKPKGGCLSCLPINPALLYLHLPLSFIFILNNITQNL